MFGRLKGALHQFNLLQDIGQQPHVEQPLAYATLGVHVGDAPELSWLELVQAALGPPPGAEIAKPWA